MAKVLAVKGGTGKHSALYLWMRKNHAVLQAEFDTNGPLWAARVEAMGEAGLTDRTGKPPTIRTAMQTWYRVCREIEKRAGAAKPSAAPPDGAVYPKPQPTTRPAPDAASTAEAEKDDNPFGFRFAAGPKDWTQDL